MIVGLTGQSGSGKSTVSRIFSDNGFYVIDADKVSREVTSQGSPALTEIAAAFEGTVDSEGRLIRRKLGDMVFSDENKLKRLEGIVFPYILKRIAELAEGAEGDVLIDAPTLFKAGADKMCDVVVSVTADEDIRLARVTKRDGITEKQARERFASQYGTDFFVRHSDHIIENNGTVLELEAAVLDIIRRIRTSPRSEQI
ncbi:MAG: dephospho-CoA kinase [Oscillospiraceae bacterium]|nr:dephospho-CoA kinase [Oscillospiraceae bacterium]